MTQAFSAKYIVLTFALACLGQGSAALAAEASKPPSASDAKEKKDEKAKKNEKPSGESDVLDESVEAKTEAKKIKPSELSLKLKDHLTVSTSFGRISAKKAGLDWNARGMNDLTAAYKLDTGFPLWTSFRYAPFDVAPEIGDAGAKVAYVGAVDGYHLGALTMFPAGSCRIFISAELGYLRVHLTDEVGVINADNPPTTGTVFTVGGEARWHISPQFSLGPGIKAGSGTFSMLQLFGNATFAF